MRPRHRTDESGFTFIELLLALAILSFAFAYSVIHLDGVTAPARLASNARELGSTIEFLRGHAVLAARPVELHVDLDRGQWTTVLPPRPSETTLDRRNEEEVLYLHPVRFHPRVRFEGIQTDAHQTVTTGTVVLTFYPGGEIAPNGFLIRIVSEEIADDQQASFSLEVNGLTGEVAYIPGYAPFEQVLDASAF